MLALNLTTQHYQRLGICALTITVLMLLAPGPVVQAAASTASSLASQLWPWSSDSLPSDASYPIDKLIHFSLFCLSGLFLARGWGPTLRGGGVAALILALVTLGVITEGLQYFIPGRFASVGDIIANTAGALAGVFLGLYPVRKQGA